MSVAMPARLRLLAAAALLCVAAAVLPSPARALPPTGAVPGLPPPAFGEGPSGAACREQLRALGVDFAEAREVSGPGGCGVADAVTLRGGLDGARLDPPVVLTCPLAVALARLHRHLVQPLAREAFGRPVRTLVHGGVYNCRPVRGGRGNLSQHALGNAMDIRAFVLEGGRRIEVADGGPFVERLAREGCLYFRTVLSPAFDAAHARHLHVDLGPVRVCE
jgi:hypothetical protein